MSGMRRCAWCNPRNPRYIEYHDREWGILRTDDRYLYEMLILESFQAGLSFECILNKREAFRLAYEGFCPERVAAFGEEKIAELLGNAAIIRNRGKIRASIENTGIFLGIVKECGSFYRYLTAFAGDRVLYETGKTRSALSDAIAADLRGRGMRFVGSTVIYSYLQAIGLIHSHEKECYLHKRGE